MHRRRVVITGMGNVVPNTEVKVPIRVSKTQEIVFPTKQVLEEAVETMCKSIKREKLRTMSKLSIYAYTAAKEALEQAGIEEEHYKYVGTAISSTLPSIDSYEDLFNIYISNPKIMPSTLPFKTMCNTSSLNLAASLGLNGRCLSPSSACAGGLQSIILAYEAIAFNRGVDVMVCGGTEEYHPYLTTIFNKLGIASKNSCKPFQIDRDGIIIGEGAGILVLEEYNKAVKRGATILAEVVGVGTNNSNNISFSDTNSIKECMELALTDAFNRDERYEDAKSVSKYIRFINAHATGTMAGDIAEGKAIGELFKGIPYVNSLKNDLGHTMAASGSIELIKTISDMRYENMFMHTNLDSKYDVDCGSNVHVVNTAPIRTDVEELITTNGETFRVIPSSNFVLKNSLGLGGVNTSVILNVFHNTYYTSKGL